MRRQVLLIAFAILITACETAPPTIDYTFQEFKPIEAEITYPDALPMVRPLECYPSEEDCRVAGYTDPADIDALELFKIRAIGNTTIAEANANALEIMVEREEAILAASKAQESITRLREEQLAWERQQRTQDKWYYRILLGLVIGAGAYASGN